MRYDGLGLRTLRFMPTARVITSGALRGLNTPNTRELAIGTVAGTAHVALLVWAVAASPFDVTTVGDLALLVYHFVGLFALGALPAVFLARRVYAPMAVFLVLLGGVLYEEWFVQQGPVVHLPPTWVLLYTLGWVVILPILAGIGALEVVVRRRLLGSDRGDAPGAGP